MTWRHLKHHYAKLDFICVTPPYILLSRTHWFIILWLYQNLAEMYVEAE